MIKFIKLYHYVLLSVLTKIAITEGSLRVISGTKVKRCTYSYVTTIARLYKELPSEAYQICTATQILPTWSLTAAHCIIEHMDRKCVILYGEFDKHTLVLRIRKTIAHPYHENVVSRQNDIGLLFTDRVENKIMGKISAVDYLSLIGRPVIFVGSGQNVTDSEKVHTRFVKISKDYKVVEEEKMYKLSYKGVSLKCTFPSPLARICVRPKCTHRMQRIQFGDSGGPLFYRGKVVGVASDGIQGTSEGWYTPVSPYLEWINNVTVKKEHADSDGNVVSTTSSF